MDLYTKNALECSKTTTHNYTTSFSLGIRSMAKKHRPGIYAVYGFVRFADEIVDTFHDKDKAALLEEFKKHTSEAIEKRFSTNPLIHSFQWVVNKYGIEINHIDAFFHSMEMDLSKKTFSQEEYRDYIYGSAEVIGLMCLRVFCDGEDTKYLEVKEQAQKLGEALQKVNFLRDFGPDYYERKRVYFPGVDFENFDNEAKRDIEKDIWKDFEMAYAGIKKLKRDARLGVYLAYRYYVELLKKIEKANPEQIKSKRFRVNNFRKLLLLINCCIRNSLSLI